MCKYMGLHLGLQYIVRRISIRDAEILSVGKIAESARFAEEEDLSLKTAFSLSCEASYESEEGVSLLISLCP